MQTIPAPGGTVKFTRDRFGYPRLEAPDRASSKYALGWLQATDRMTQMAIMLKIARGGLMSLVGDTPFARTLTRLLHMVDLDRGIESQAAAADGETRRMLEAYCKGFNDAADRRVWPEILELVGLEVPELRPHHCFLGYRLVCFFGLTSLQQTSELAIADLVADGVDEEVLEILLGEGATGVDLESLEGLEIPEEMSLLSAMPAGGSNGIAVGADRSSTDGALLIADPHLEIGRFPPALYAAHESRADGGYTQGLYIPGVPWLFVGRTECVGWTYTFANADNVDILVERCDTGRYLADGEWRPFERREETVEVPGAEDETWVFHDNDYGAVAGENPDGDLPCVRWAGLHDSTLEDVERFLAFENCEDARELAEKMRGLDTVSVHGLVVDADGNVAQTHTGRVDARPEDWTGAYPRKGWDLASRDPDRCDESARPAPRLNPDSGVVVSANEQKLGADGSLWCNLPQPPYRHERIRRTIGTSDPVELEDLVDGVVDETDLSAKRLVETWGEMLPDDSEAQRLREWAATHEWDLDDDDREMLGLFHALHREVARELLGTRLGDGRASDFVDGLGILFNFQFHLDDVLAGERPDLVDDEELGEAVAAAWPRARDRAASADWHIPLRESFDNQLTDGLLPEWLGFSTPEFDIPGGPVSPFQSNVLDFGESLMFGPAGRLVFDMSEEGSWYEIPGGASEHRLGPGYGMGVEAWCEGEFAPLGEPEWFEGRSLLH